MKYIIATSLLTAPLCVGAEATAPEEMQQPTTDSTVESFVEALCDAYELLDSITDKATADAAADEVAQRMAYLQDRTIAVQYVPEETIAPLLDAAGMTPEYLDGIYTRLITNSFYGSTALAQALGREPSAAMPKENASAELIDTLSAELMQNPAVGDVCLAGGPGLSVETAWVLSTDPSKLSAIDAIIGAIPGAEIEDRKLEKGEDGRAYGLFTLLVPREGKAYRVQMWFDATQLLLTQQNATTPQPHPTQPEAYAPMPVQPGYVHEPHPQELHQYTPEQKAECAREYAEALAQQVRIYSSVTDKATADAAVEPLKALELRMEALNTILAYVSPQELAAAVEKAGVTPAALKEQSLRLIEADFFGSEALKHQFNN